MASASDEGLCFGSEDIDALISVLPTEVELLKRAWRNEKASPEILQFQEDVVRNARVQIQNIEDTVEASAKNGKDALTVSLYQMDLDMTEFLLRSYLRSITYLLFYQLRIFSFMFYYPCVLVQLVLHVYSGSVPEPQLDTFVFCKIKGSIGSFQLDAIGDEVVDLIVDDLYVLRYNFQ
ncbi:hypothetical protein MKX01_028558 [Papaver californicum]|nr:hypothetical protein MKX01_028558 [Papaver californicum]